MTELRTIPNEENPFLDHEKKSSEDELELKDVFMKLTEKSTIPPLSLIHQKISLFWKIIWLLVMVTGISMSIYQSVELVKNYLRYPSFISEVEIRNKSLYFPSVTLCPLATVNWQKVIESNHSLMHFIEEKSSNVEVKSVLIDIMKEKVHEMSREEKSKILMEIEDWIVHCEVNDAEGNSFQCRANEVTTYSPYYGKCLTINPGFQEELKLRMNQFNDMILVAVAKEGVEFPQLLIPGFILSIHAPGTAPVIDLNKKMVVLPGEFLQIVINVMDIKRLHAPFASNCTDDTEEFPMFLKTFSPYQTSETPYIYSTEECLMTCYLFNAITFDNCYYEHAAIKEEYEQSNYPLCLIKNSTDRLSTLISSEMCDELCQKPCRELLYDWTPKSSKLSNRLGFIKIMEELVADYDYEGMITDELVMISLKLDSTSYVFGEETQKYEIEDILGSIGGNLGLWIGVSFLSMFEIFELLSNIAVYLFRKILKRKQSS